MPKRTSPLEATSSFSVDFSLSLVDNNNKFRIEVSVSPQAVGNDDWIGIYASEDDLKSDIESGLRDERMNANETWEWVVRFNVLSGQTLYWDSDISANTGYIAAYFKKDYPSGLYKFVTRSAAYGGRRILSQIDHVVVLMMENRSLDNLLGYLYPTGENPSHFIPAGSPPVYNGLQTGTFSNQFASGGTVDASQGADNFVVPSPDPGEEFTDMQYQIFNSSSDWTNANMKGFLQNYYAVIQQEDGGTESQAAQIMQSYSPGQLPVISTLAKSFAVSDAWFASMPAQTWPNRGFVHTGSSDGHINNSLELYDIETIFNLLEDQSLSWGVFSDSGAPSLVHIMFPKLLDKITHFHFDLDFYKKCAKPKDAPMADKLPAYSFIEPRFIIDDQSYHPPHNVLRGEEYLAKIYNAIRECPYRDKILFIVTFDEHGGCYDHVEPPGNAQPPEPWPVSRDGTFNYDRFGCRVPAIIVSSYTKAGTVFRSETSVPYDHTSILATLREWFGINTESFQTYLPSPRIAAAPTIQSVLGDQVVNDWPEIKAPNAPQYSEPDKPIDDLVFSMVTGEESRRQGRTITPAEAEQLRQRIRTSQDAVDYFAEQPVAAELGKQRVRKGVVPRP